MVACSVLEIFVIRIKFISDLFVKFISHAIFMDTPPKHEFKLFD